MDMTGIKRNLVHKAHDLLGMFPAVAIMGHVRSVKQPWPKTYASSGNTLIKRTQMILTVKQITPVYFFSTMNKMSSLMRLRYGQDSSLFSEK